ncbi:DNA polymerase IV [Tistrella mobilis]|jgi:DNA polymerase-4|uniref:DNA polymerase IV n=1 Tax=Tistrella mobilis TaxID=171437 RepID=UPI003558E60A
MSAAPAADDGGTDQASPPVISPPAGCTPASAAGWLCRDCGSTRAAEDDSRRCPACGSTRIVIHAELHRLTIAHVDCDAFYASVEKRDRPELAQRPVIVGGGHRGVVSTCCYLARMKGVRSAMPMFKARELCPDAVVLPPDMARYREAGLKIRRLMRALTPLVEPLSIDEAYLDLGPESGAPDSRASPAQRLAALARRVEREVGVTVSVGLGPNKFLAKLASELDKPRGFAVIGAAEATAFLADKPVRMLWGVGPAFERRLATDGITRIGQLQSLGPQALARRYGRIGAQIAGFASGRDPRRVTPSRPAKSVSAETTLARDERAADRLAELLPPLAERVAARLAGSRLVAEGVVLKLKTADFQTLTRSRRLKVPTDQSAPLIAAAQDLLTAEATGHTAFRLIGLGAQPVRNREGDPAAPDLFGAASG